MVNSLRLTTKCISTGLLFLNWKEKIINSPSFVMISCLLKPLTSYLTFHHNKNTALSSEERARSWIAVKNLIFCSKLLKNTFPVLLLTFPPSCLKYMQFLCTLLLHSHLFIAMLSNCKMEKRLKDMFSIH